MMTGIDMIKSSIINDVLSIHEIQPGDGTRYIVQIAKLPESNVGLGHCEGGYYSISLLNLRGGSFVFPCNGFLSTLYATEKMGSHTNPWTVRAVLILLKALKLPNLEVEEQDPGNL